MPVFSEKTLSAADVCIYCGNVDPPLTKEHIIPFCLGGRYTIPRSSCAECQKATSLLEFHVARTAYGLIRTALQFPSRHKGSRSTTAAVTLEFADLRPPIEIDLPIEDAPMCIIVPHYPSLPQEDNWMNPVFPRPEVIAMSLPADLRSRDMRLRNLRNMYGAQRTVIKSPSFRIGAFESLLWKISTGFLWQIDPDSVRRSGIGMLAIKKPKLGDDIDFENLFSEPSKISHSNLPRVAVFTRDVENHYFIYCSIKLFGKIGFPVYFSRIQNVSGTKIPLVEFQ